MDWKLEINKIANGYIISYEEEVVDGFKVSKKEVFQDDGDDRLKCHEELLWYIIDYFNFGGSKHDKERIRIIREDQGNDYKA